MRPNLGTPMSARELRRRAEREAPDDSELVTIYKRANGEDVGKAQPLTTKRIINAMRAAFQAGRASLAASAVTAITPETGNSATAKGAAITSESGAASAGSEPVAINREALIDAIAQGLHGTWHCTRVWEAWHVGTMSQDDFEPVDESDTPADLADAVLALMPTHPSPPEGMVMVPKEPTMAMRIAAKTADMDHTNLSDWMISDWPEFKRIWDAMLKATPPTTSAGSGKGE